MLLKNSFFITLLIINSILFANLPEIGQGYNDVIFKQILSDINENSKRLHQHKELIPVQFYKYKLSDNESIFTISSRFNLTYETIATLNRIDNQLFFNNIESVIIPTCQGLFYYTEVYQDPTEVILENKKVYFYPGRSFTGKERLNFLVTPFTSPLKKMTITSIFGYRENPFTSVKEFHSGIDLKASTGTKVYSPYNGVIDSVGYSEFYGNYLIIKHTNNYSSHFYHLDKIIFKEGKFINKGDYIAQTGNSGKSTGPHLHFEIHYKNEPINPTILLGDV